MTLSLSNLPYYYQDNNFLNKGADNIQDWLEKSYGVKGFDSPTEDITTLFAQLISNAGFNPYDAFDSYDPGLENSPMGDYLNDVKRRASDPYYKLKDNEYYSYTGSYPGVEINTTTNDELLGTIDPRDNLTLAQKVNSVLNNVTDNSLRIRINGIYSNVSINQAQSTPEGRAALVTLYKQLTGELQGLKEYTLTNSEIQSVLEEINTLNGDGVLGSLEAKIDAGQAELIEVFRSQLSSIVSKSSLQSVQLIFKGESSSADGDPNVNNDGEIAFANGQTKEQMKLALFGADGDYVTNPFYQYYVGLRTNPDLTFIESINQANPNYNKSKPLIKDSDPFKTSDYSGIQAQDEQLGPADILDDLYITQELKAYYKQYEEAVNRAKSLELSLTLALQNSAEFDFRKVLAEKVLALLDTEHKLQVSNESSIANIIKRGSSTGPSALQEGVSSHAAFDGFYGNTNTKATPTDNGGSLVDPYEIVINGTKYILGKDDNSNGNIDNVSEILGITDTMENPFQSLLQLDLNKDGLVSKEELINNGIVLKAVDDSGKFTNNNFDLSMINNIDLKKLNPLKNGNSVGTFEMTFLNGRTLQGSQTFEDQAYFNTLFGKLVDLRPYRGTTVKTDATAKTTTSAATTSKTATTAAASAAQTSADLTRSILLKQINSMYSALIVDDTSNIETILDNICWKQSTILTPAQKIRIVDSIDPLMPVYQIESEIKNALKNLNS